MSFPHHQRRGVGSREGDEPGGTVTPLRVDAMQSPWGHAKTGLLTTEFDRLFVYASPLMDRTRSARSATIWSLCSVTTSGPSRYPRNQAGLACVTPGKALVNILNSEIIALQSGKTAFLDQHAFYGFALL